MAWGYCSSRIPSLTLSIDIGSPSSWKLFQELLRKWCLGLWQPQTSIRTAFGTLFFFCIKSLFSLRDLTCKYVTNNARGDGHGWGLLLIFLGGEMEGTLVWEGEREEVSLFVCLFVLAQGNKSGSRSQTISMCPRVHETTFFRMSFHLILKGGGEWRGGRGGKKLKLT